MAKKKKKKSRIKKLFKNLAKVAALGAVGYGASKLFGGRKRPSVENVLASEDVNIAPPLVDAADAGTTFIKEKAPPRMDIKDVMPDATNGSKYIPWNERNSRGLNAKMMQRAAMNKVPPSMRGGLKHAEGYQILHPGRQQYPGGWEGGYSMRAKGGRIGAKKGGSVTGIAKRGFGRALMKGKK